MRNEPNLGPKPKVRNEPNFGRQTQIASENLECETNPIWI